MMGIGKMLVKVINKQEIIDYSIISCLLITLTNILPIPIHDEGANSFLSGFVVLVGINNTQPTTDNAAKNVNNSHIIKHHCFILVCYYNLVIINS